MKLDTSFIALQHQSTGSCWIHYVSSRPAAQTVSEQTSVEAHVASLDTRLPSC